MRKRIHAELDKQLNRAQHQRARHEVAMFRLTSEIDRLVAQRLQEYGVCKHNVAFEDCLRCRMVEACEGIRKRHAAGAR